MSKTHTPATGKKGIERSTGMNRSVSQQTPGRPPNYSVSFRPEQTLYMTIPPDGGYAWVIVFCSFLTNFVVDGIMYSYGKLLPFFVSDINLTKTQIALINSLQNAMYYFVGPICSAFVNKYGFRTVAIVGVLISGIATFASSYTYSFTLLAIFYGVLGGTGYGMIYAPSIIIIGFYFEKYRAIATGLAVSGSGFGTLIISALHTTLLERYGLQRTIQFQALCVLCCAFFSLSYVPLKPVVITVTEEQRSMSEASSQASTEIKVDQFSRVFAPQKTQNVMDTIKRTSSLSISSSKPPTTSSILKQSRKLASLPEEHHSKNSCKRCCRKCCKSNCCKSCCAKKEKKPDGYQFRPLYKDDIFFGGSLSLVEEYKRVQSDGALVITDESSQAVPTRRRTSILYNLSITRAPIAPPKRNRRDIISHAITSALGLLFDASLLKSCTFVIISIAGFISALGQFSTYVFVTNRAELNGMPKEQTVWLIPILGVSNLVGRVAAGFLSFTPSIDPSKATGIAYMVSGIATIVTGLRQHDSAAYQYLYCVIYGFTVAFFSSLKSVIFVNNLGLDRLTNAFGFTSLIMGFGLLLGSPISGYLYELTNDYMYGFIVCGILLIIAGFLFMFIDCVRRWETRKAQAKETKRVSFYSP